MHPLEIKENINFIGRAFEIGKLRTIATANEANIIVMYGRRRVGKTELLEQSFRLRNLLKFEGIEGLSEEKQFANVMQQWSVYTGDPILAKVVLNSWSEFFQLLAKHVAEGTWTIYLEETQWLANYKSTLISELKYVWDNYFRHNPNLIIIICGSSPSFMLDHVVHSKALYNRSQYEFHLKEFNLPETQVFLNSYVEDKSPKSTREILDAYLTVGGIPEYLKWLKKDSSVFLSLCQHSFVANSFFSMEYEKIFTSSLSNNKNYKEIVEILSQKRFETKEGLAKKLKIKPGGTLSQLLTDLEKCGLIAQYTPFNLSEKSLLVRYTIVDNYLQYYFKFIKPIAKHIQNGDYRQNPRAAIQMDSYLKWLGFAFERLIRKHHRVIATILGFSGIHYTSGVFFSRATNKVDRGFQIDLIFDRADHVYTICEIKYLQGKVDASVIQSFEQKLALFPNKNNKTIHRVLICNEGADDALKNQSYFDAVITSTDLMDPRYW